MKNKKLECNSEKKMEKKLVKMAKKIAELEVNSSCPLFAYQPKFPDSVKKLRKF